MGFVVVVVVGHGGHGVAESVRIPFRESGMVLLPAIPILQAPASERPRWMMIMMMIRFTAVHAGVNVLAFRGVHSAVAIILVFSPKKDTNKPPHPKTSS